MVEILLGLVLIAAGTGLLLWAKARVVQHVAELPPDQYWANTLPLILDVALGTLGASMIAGGANIMLGLV